MPLREGVAAIQDSVGSALQTSWPAPVTLTLDLLGFDYPGEMTLMFLEAVQDLIDSGLVICEAVIITSNSGPRVIDAALTARGRAMFEPKGRAAA